MTHMFRGYLCQNLRAGCAHHLHDALQLVNVCLAQEMPTGQAETFPRPPDLRSTTQNLLFYTWGRRYSPRRYRMGQRRQDWPERARAHFS